MLINFGTREETIHFKPLTRGCCLAFCPKCLENKCYWHWLMLLTRVNIEHQIVFTIITLCTAFLFYFHKIKHANKSNRVWVDWHRNDHKIARKYDQSIFGTIVSFSSICFYFCHNQYSPLSFLLRFYPSRKDKYIYCWISVQIPTLLIHSIYLFFLCVHSLNWLFPIHFFLLSVCFFLTQWWKKFFLVISFMTHLLFFFYINSNLLVSVQFFLFILQWIYKQFNLWKTYRDIVKSYNVIFS